MWLNHPGYPALGCLYTILWFQVEDAVTMGWALPCVAICEFFRGSAPKNGLVKGCYEMKLISLLLYCDIVAIYNSATDDLQLYIV